MKQSRRDAKHHHTIIAYKPNDKDIAVLNIVDSVIKKRNFRLNKILETVGHRKRG
jgi:hypothetical protein